LKVIIADYTPDDYDYEPEEGSRRAKKADYDQVDVIPVSDPNAATMAQKVVQYQAVLQLAQSAPQLYNLPLLHRQMIEVLGVKNASKLVPIEEDEIPTDPVQENQNLLTNKPVKAFIEQDHQSHITVHMAAMQDPKILALVSQSPMAQAMQAAMAAHISEHIAFEYRKQIEATIGLQLPTKEQNKQMKPDVAAQVAQLTAQAAKQLLTKNQGEAAQQQAQQTAQDPIVQMQMQELQLKQADMQLKEKKLQIDATEKADRIRVEESRIAAQKEIAAMQVGATAAAARDKLAHQQETEGVRMGLDVAKHKAQLAHQSHQQARQAVHASKQKPNKGN
jgi:hypothetical protein